MKLVLQLFLEINLGRGILLRVLRLADLLIFVFVVTVVLLVLDLIILLLFVVALIFFGFSGCGSGLIAASWLLRGQRALDLLDLLLILGNLLVAAVVVALELLDGPLFAV